MSPVVRLLAAGALLGCTLAPVAAAEPSAKRPVKNDPNETVCEKQEVLGSRLAVRRVCRTRAEWAEQRRSDRDAVQASQLNTCLKQAGC